MAMMFDLNSQNVLQFVAVTIVKMWENVDNSRQKLVRLFSSINYFSLVLALIAN